MSPATIEEVEPVEDVAKPGRVYAIDADESKGEIHVEGNTARVWLLFGDWVRLPGVTRIEFDDDADSGMANITAMYWFCNQPLRSVGDESKAALARFRHYARFKKVTADSPDSLPEIERDAIRELVGQSM